MYTWIRILASIVAGTDEAWRDHVYIVGGAVRNHLLNQPIKDVDLVVDRVRGGCEVRDVVDHISRHVRSDAVYNQYGVAILTVKDHHRGPDLYGTVTEIAMARKESYAGGLMKGKGYKPTDVVPATIEEDCIRRDFTVNTLLWRLVDISAQDVRGATVMDLTGSGIEDLSSGILRTPTDPERTFTDDPTRILRAIKFAARYDLRPTPEVQEAMCRNASLLSQMPWEAVGKILVDDLLLAPAYGAALRHLAGPIADEVGRMISDKPPFRSYLMRQFRDLDMGRMFAIESLGWGVTPLSSFASDEVLQIAAAIRDLSPEDARRYFDSVLRPPVDNESLIGEFAIPPRERGDLARHARRALLSEPALAADPSKLTEAVRKLWSSLHAG